MREGARKRTVTWCSRVVQTETGRRVGRRRPDTYGPLSCGSKSGAIWPVWSDRRSIVFEEHVGKTE